MMNLKDTIRRVLREETSPTLRRIIRRANLEKIDKLFRDGLGIMTTRYLQNKHNWHNMEINKFKQAIISYVIVDICTRYSDICYGNGDFYNQVFDFIWNHYSDEMEERWDKINSGKFD
jgi:hypothetical protein